MYFLFELPLINYDCNVARIWSWHSEYWSYWPICQSWCWCPCTEECADNGYTNDEEELSPWEEEDEVHLQYEVLLQRHREPDEDSNHNSKRARGNNEDEWLIEVEKFDPPTCEPHSSQDGDFFPLFVHIWCHWGAEGEEAEKHGNRDDWVEDDVDNLRNHGS